jgi:hypothetical protein
MNPLLELQNWYKSNCNGEWEHQYGVQIETLDNPGWMLKVNFKGTDLEGRSFNEISDETSDSDWYFCYVKDNQFEGVGDPDKLEFLLKTFAVWANKSAS